MSEPVWLELAEALAIHDALIAEFGGSPGLRDGGLLEAALARPRQLHAYLDDSDLVTLAAAYIATVVRNHPFVDGNKRAGFTFGLVFLDTNGVWIEGDNNEAARLIYDLAGGTSSETDVVAWLSRNAVQEDLT